MQTGIHRQCLSKTALRAKEDARAAFAEQKDGLHWIVVDNFLERHAFDVLARQFPLEDTKIDVEYSRSTEFLKRQVHPAKQEDSELDALMREASRGEIADWVRYVTSNNDAWLDDALPGAGLHETPPGGSLGMHVDNLHLGTSGALRRYNLIIYAPPAWESSWGGDLFVGNRAHWKRKGDHRKPQFSAISPLSNRAFLFETTSMSLHGHPEPLKAPTGASRRSLSLWYYDSNHEAPVQRTTFVEDALPRRLADWLFNHGIGTAYYKLRRLRKNPTQTDDRKLTEDLVKQP